MKILKKFSVFMLAICMLLSVTSVLVSAENNIVSFDIQGTEVYSEIYDVLEMVNEYRADAGLSALTLDAELTAAAMQRAAECAIYFSHTRPSGESCFTVFPNRLNGRRAENIAIGQRNASGVMNSWMNSSGHHANIMNTSNRSIGIGCFYCPDGTYSWVQLFSSATAIPPSSTLQNKNVTTTIEATRGLLGLACALEETSTPNHFELCVYNVNIEFSYHYIPLTGDTIYFTSSNPNVCKITNKTHLEYVGNGTSIISGYLDGVLFFQTEHKVGNTTPHQHKYTETVTSPTCTTGGFTTYTCEGCGDSYVGDRTNPIPHNYNSVVTAPTCTTGGFTTHTCKNCGDSYISSRTNPVPHDYKVTAIPNGYLYECKNCEHSYQDVTESPEILMGDIDKNGVVNNADLVRVARYIVGLENKIDLTAADLDKSGNITNSDLVARARSIVGL